MTSPYQQPSPQTQEFPARVAIVTGGGRGIGAAIAERLAQSGFRVAISYRTSGEKATAVAERISQSGGAAKAIQADLERREDITRLFEATEAAFGPPDLLVNNAGRSELAPLAEASEEHVGRVLGVNLGAVVYASQEAARRFAENGGGKIINISSSFSTDPAPGSSVYAASKAGVNALTLALAKELGPQGITVNAVAPGPTETEGLKEAQGGEEQFEAGAREYLAGRTTLGRLGQPEDIAGVVALLVSDEAGWVTGQVVHASGGFAP